MRKLLVLFAAAWIGVNLGAAWVSYDRKLPYDLDYVDREGAAGNIGEDWLLGWGSGLAVPMWLIALGAILTVMSTLGRGAGRVGAFVLAMVAGASVAYTLASRHATDRLADVGGDVTASSLVIASLALSGLIVLLGLTSWLTAPREALR